MIVSKVGAKWLFIIKKNKTFLQKDALLCYNCYLDVIEQNTTKF